MKILFVHNSYQLHGGEDVVVEQELELLRQHHDVEILYFQNQGGWKGAVQFLCSIWNIGAARTVNKMIKEFQPDVVHIHNWHFALGPLVFRMINKMGIPIVHTLHNYRLLCPSGILFYQGQLFTDSLRQSFPWSAIKNKVYRSSVIQTFWLAFIVWFHKKIGTWQKIDLFLCLTSFAVKLFKQSNFGISREQFSVKPNFVEDSDFSYKKDNYFIFVGRLSKEKGINLLLEAFIINGEQLKIIGEGPELNKVIDTASKYDNISYLGFQNKAFIIEKLKKAKALIFTSICYEGMPMTILESFSTGTAVIGPNIGGSNEIIKHGENGLIYQVGNIEDLNSKISFLNTDESLQNKLSIGARSSYELNYSPDKNYKMLMDIYKTVINEKK